MREIRSSGSVEGVMGNHDSYSDSERAGNWIRDRLDCTAGIGQHLLGNRQKLPVRAHLLGPALSRAHALQPLHPLPRGPLAAGETGHALPGAISRKRPIKRVKTRTVSQSSVASVGQMNVGFRHRRGEAPVPSISVPPSITLDGAEYLPVTVY